MRTMMRRWDPEIFCLSICYLLSIMLGAHDWLVTSGLGFRHNGMLLQFAAVPTLATFGIMLLRRFIAALREKDALNRDLEERVASKAQQIEETFRRNRELESAQLLSQERERIMRDMHDGVGSQLIGMTGYLDHGNPRDALLSQELQTALRELRLMIDSLEDMEGDVVVALGLFRNRIQPQVDAAGLSMSWQVADLPRVPDLGPERVLHFMRILQEAVVNSIRHAAATNLSVSTCVDGIVNGKRCISISVSDDGSGFEGLRNRGRGLDNMRHRAASAGLELEIHSDANGTTITIGFPDPEVETQ
jgi:signal transduction histidine kinase